MPIKIPEYFGANSTRFVEGPDAFIFDNIIAMVTMTMAEVAVDVYTIATTKILLIPAPGQTKFSSVRTRTIKHNLTLTVMNCKFPFLLVRIYIILWQVLKNNLWFNLASEVIELFWTNVLSIKKVKFAGK